MPDIPNVLRRDEHYTVPFLVDNLFDYPYFVRNYMPMGFATDKRVAIVGAGLAGLVAAHELTRWLPGTPRIDVYEASDRIGGRTYSKSFPDTTYPLAELGAMRVPPAERLFLYYFRDLFMHTLGPRGQFPNPGIVKTQVVYGGQSVEFGPQELGEVQDFPAQCDFVEEVVPHPCQPALPPKSPLSLLRLHNDWNRVVGPLIAPIDDALKIGDREMVYLLWQERIHDYKDMSLLDFIHLKQAELEWSQDDIDIFAAVGTGIGGLGPFFANSFLEILRLAVNRLDDCLTTVPEGVSQLANSLCLSARDKIDLKLSHEVTALCKGPGEGELTLHARRLQTHGFESVSAEYDAVILATGTRRMDVMGLTLPSGPCESDGDPLPNLQQKEAIHRLHISSASKLFVRTRRFWEDSGYAGPRVILTDQLPRAVYTLEYPNNTGVVLLSYVWEDDSEKLLGLSHRERFEHFRRILRTISPDFAAGLESVRDIDILAIDWEAEEFYLGAFKIHSPGQEAYLRDLYNQFRSANDDDPNNPDEGVYLANENISYAGGWMEGVLQSGVNAATAVLKRLGTTSWGGVDTPLDPVPPLPYDYG